MIFLFYKNILKYWFNGKLQLAKRNVYNLTAVTDINSLLLYLRLGVPCQCKTVKRLPSSAIADAAILAWSEETARVLQWNSSCF